jgi:galactonate dehydratase
MKITGIETFVVSNGFTPPRPWHFCAIRTDAGLTGYSEFGSDGITHGLVGLVKDLGQRLIGKDPTAVEKHYLDLYRAVRQAPYGATQQAIAGIELALWDLAGKALEVPVYKLMGGPHRERQWVYWSHLATYRAHNWKLLGAKPLKTLQDLADAAREAPARGYTAFKTNIIWPGEPARAISQGRPRPARSGGLSRHRQAGGGADRGDA